ncbi:hypothetical protein [Domibacillus robiginosus]|uniref:hypothetical protein n=1 Tax=Domibacillus robiginosus TaxID=1071054 RepID=UPI00067B1FF8|nr:hypothetical protein [Domibacillus robiginosus]
MSNIGTGKKAKEFSNLLGKKDTTHKNEAQIKSAVRKLGGNSEEEAEKKVELKQVPLQLELGLHNQIKQFCVEHDKRLLHVMEAAAIEFLNQFEAADEKTKEAMLEKVIERKKIRSK